MEHENSPCGKCDIGAYCVEAMLNPLARKFGALSAEERVAQMPRCKTYNRPCLGAQDFHDCIVDLDSTMQSVLQPSQLERTNE